MVATVQKFHYEAYGYGYGVMVLRCYGFQPFGNGPYQDFLFGPYQGVHSFLCTRVALATHYHVQGITAQNNFPE